MGRINGNFLDGLFAPRQSGDEKTTGGGLFGNSARYWRENQGFNQAATSGANDKNQPTEGGEAETFWVGKPVAAKDKPADAGKIGENLLREQFGFEDIDIQSYKKLYGDLTIFDEKQGAINEKAGKSCKAATIEQIQKWQTSADGKKVAVTLPETMVRRLRDFRQERLIERRATDVSDSQLRAKLENSLKSVVTQTGQARADALTDLRNVLEDDSPDGKKAAAVVKLVAGLPENRQNPFTQMLLAKIELKEIYSGENVMFNPNDLTKIEQRIDRAVDLASGCDDASKKRDSTKAVSRVEAQALNEEAARLAERFGKPSDARFRTMLARFYAVGDAERNKYEAMRFPQMTTLPRLPENSAASMSAPSKESLALEQFRRENALQDVNKELSEDPQKREWKTRERTDGKGGVETEAYQQFQKEGSMKPEGVQDSKSKIYVNEKGKILPDEVNAYRSMPVTTRQTNERDEINAGGTTRAFATAGAVGAIEEVNKWTPLIADLYYDTTANKIAKREKLEKAAFDADNFPVPPKPERIQQMKRDLLAYRYNTQSEYQRVQSTMKRLEDLSHAFWKR